MARKLRYYEKKRGHRRTGSRLFGSVGEAAFFAVLFVAGCAGTVSGIVWLIVPEWRVNHGFVAWWIWSTLLVPASFVVIGAGGLVYAALHWGNSAERRAAVVRSVPASELFDLPASADSKFPYIPDGSEITSSPGTHLAYRLPLTHSPGWTLFGLLAAAIAWNGAVSVFLVMSARSFFAGTPDWPMTLFSLPFLIVGVALVVVFARVLRHTAAIGPTLVEISDHPLLPGDLYRLFLSQSGNLTLRSMEVSLVCEEEAVFRQGTDARTESREVFRQPLHAVGGATIRPGEPLETECDLPVPAEAMHSFRATHNQIQWKLLVSGEIVGWQAFQRSFPVVVRPPSISPLGGISQPSGAADR